MGRPPGAIKREHERKEKGLYFSIFGGIFLQCFTYFYFPDWALQTVQPALRAAPGKGKLLDFLGCRQRNRDHCVGGRGTRDTNSVWTPEVLWREEASHGKMSFQDVNSEVPVLEDSQQKSEDTYRGCSRGGS